MGIIQFKTNQQIALEEERLIEDLIELEEENKRQVVSDNLVSYLRRAWEDAKREKIPIKEQILENMRAIRGEYSPQKLEEIRTLGGSEIYMRITETKTRHCEAWVKDILFQPNNIPWDIEPTPVEEIPKHEEIRILSDYLGKVIDDIFAIAINTGNEIDHLFLGEYLRELIPEVKEKSLQIIKKYAKDQTSKMKQVIHDQLIEGGWYDSIEDVIQDAICKTGFLKGPILRIEKQRKIVVDKDGDVKVIVEDVRIPTYERRSPLDIYPGPGATDINDSYLFDKLLYTPSQIQSFIGLPGFKEDAIRSVLQECASGVLRDWTDIDQERVELEEKSPEMIHDWEYIEVLEYWGPVQGRFLHEWDESLKEKAPDADKFYEINALIIGNHVIKAILNPDPMGKRPYSKASFIEKAGAFWGEGLPEIISDVQVACNACARALVNNIGLASGPQIVINEDMLADFERGEFVPWKRWWVNGSDLSGTKKPIEFYQPEMVSHQLVTVFEFFIRQANESSGVPAYAHGDPRVGGAGNTASGLSMLMTQSSRGIKLFIKNIDRKIIEDSLYRQYYWNMERKRFTGLIGDFKIVAKGSVSLIAKEQQATRMAELLAITAQTQTLSMEEQRNLTKKVFKAHEIDPNEIFLEDIGTPTPPIGDIKKPQTLNVAGEPAQGTDFRLVYERGGPPASPI